MDKRCINCEFYSGKRSIKREVMVFSNNKYDAESQTSQGTCIKTGRNVGNGYGSAIGCRYYQEWGQITLKNLEEEQKRQRKEQQRIQNNVERIQYNNNNSSYKSDTDSRNNALFGKLLVIAIAVVVIIVISLLIYNHFKDEVQGTYYLSDISGTANGLSANPSENYIVLKKGKGTYYFSMINPAGNSVIEFEYSGRDKYSVEFSNKNIIMLSSGDIRVFLEFENGTYAVFLYKKK